MEILRHKRNVRVNTGLHPAVYGLLAGCVLWIVATAWFFFAVESYGALQIAVVAFLAAAFLLTPFLLARSSGARAEPGSLRDWLQGEFQVADGAVTGGTALAMILCAPVAGAAGITVVSFIAWLAAAGLI